jgi:hypothetical protein
MFIVKDSYRDSLRDIVNSIEDAQNQYQTLDILRRLDRRVAEVEKTVVPGPASQMTGIPFNADTVSAHFASLARLVHSIPGHPEDKARFADMEGVVASLPKNGNWSALDEAQYDSAILNGIGDERLLRDAEEERAVREARLKICTIVSYILYPIGWIIGVVGKLYDLPGINAPGL